MSVVTLSNNCPRQSAGKNPFVSLTIIKIVSNEYSLHSPFVKRCIKNMIPINSIFIFTKFIKYFVKNLEFYVKKQFLEIVNNTLH